MTEAHTWKRGESGALAIIPARGGSRGIPRKNVRMLAGKPLVAHSIECALRAGSVSRVVVSTEDAEIAAVSERYGAEVVRRPAEISGDAASSESALLHTLQHLRESEGYEPDLTVFLQCTSPLTTPEDIDGTVQALLGAEADTALAVAPFHYFLWRGTSGGDAVGINHDKRVRLPRQQRRAQYLETGAVYAMRTAAFLQAQHRFFGKTAMYVMPPERCLEIDEPIDLEVAEVLLRRRHRLERLRLLPNRVSALVLDFDGVFTDNRVLVFQDGSEAVICSRGDGWGLAALRRQGIPALVISTEANPVVEARCRKLGLEFVQGVRDKVSTLAEWCATHGVDCQQAVYVGNDLNDLDCMAKVGCPVAVADAHPQVQAAAMVVLDAPGGRGAIREIIDLIVERVEAGQDAAGG